MFLGVHLELRTDDVDFLALYGDVCNPTLAI
jgi:hypothetical protein